MSQYLRRFWLPVYLGSTLRTNLHTFLVAVFNCLGNSKMDLSLPPT